MWKRISRILQANEEHTRIEQEKEERGDASQIFKLAIVQIEQAIQKNTVIWENVRKNKEELYQKIEQIKYAIQQEETSLQYALRGKNKSLANSHIIQKENLEKQKREFETLYNNVLQTWQQMQLQKQKLTLQLQELKTKEILLTNKLQNAKNQRELQLVLDDLEISNEIDLFEDKVNQAQIEVDLVDGVLDIENQIYGLEANSLQDLDKKFDNYQQEQQDKVQEKQRKRVEQLFSRNEHKTQQQKQNEKKELEEKRKKLLEQFKTNHTKTANSNKNKKLEDKSESVNNFFSQSDNVEDKSTKTAKESIMSDFFGNTTNTNKVEEKKEKPQKEIEKKSEEQLSKEEQMKKFFGK